MKKKYLVLSVVLVIAITSIYILFNINTYTIPDNKEQIAIGVKRFNNVPNTLLKDKQKNMMKITDTNVNFDIKQEVNVANKKFVLYLSGSMLGCTELTKGLNNKYKAEYSSTGTNFFTTTIYSTNKGKYLVLCGKNYNMKMAHMKTTLNGTEYKINIPQQEYFISYCHLPNNIKDRFLDIHNIHIFDTKNIDITDEALKNLI